MATAEKIHVFERYGLGVAPFRFVGMSRCVYQAIPGDPNCPIQPGTSCDFCGLGISNVCAIEDANGKRFKVGCDCVRKTGDAGLQRKLTDAERAHNRDLRKARKARKEAARAERNLTECARDLDDLAKLENDVGFAGSFASDVAGRIRLGKQAGLTPRQRDLLDRLLTEKGAA